MVSTLFFMICLIVFLRIVFWAIIQDNKEQAYGEDARDKTFLALKDYEQKEEQE